MDKKKQRKVVMVLIGIVFGLLICELILQISGLLVQRKMPLNDLKNKKGIRIICLGDSFTFGSGAAPESSYPEQLEGILDDKISKKSFEVINLGYPGKNSALLAQELPQVIKDYMPDMVLVMIGVNDYCNFQGLGRDFKNGFNRPSFLDNVKTVKLLNILKVNLQARFSPAMSPESGKKIFAYFSLIIEAAQQRNMRNLKKAELLCQKAIKNFPDLGLGYLELARVYQDKKAFSQSLEVLKKAAGIVVTEEELPIFSGLIELSRRAEKSEDYDISLRALVLAACFSIDNEQVYAEFDHIFALTEDPQKAILVYKFLEEVFPLDKLITVRLAKMYKAVRDFKQAKKYWNTLLENNDFENEAVKEIANADFFIRQGVSSAFNEYGQGWSKEFLNDIMLLKKSNVKSEKNYITKNQRILLKNETARNYLDPVLARKIEFIVHSCDDAGVDLIFVSYPLLVQPYVLAQVKKSNTGFVDLRSEFLKVLETGGWDDFFVHDGHCTALGYEIIAKAVADEIDKYID